MSPQPDIADGPVVGLVVGNPRAGSRTMSVAAEVARQIAGAVSGKLGPAVDVAVHGPAVLDPDAAHVRADLDAVQRVDILVVASPTYKATYTGLLKVFLDRYGPPALDGIVAVPVMVGGAPVHAMAPEVHLRPLLVELGAVVPTRGLFVVEDELGRLSAVVGDWLATAGGALRAAIRQKWENH
ncbi:NAD(P)H-dependent oxidoreductase [Nocardia elegans]|uniref:NADPH-dependent FMN reductase n=1 Tax=Nocardia elegans TaxID=300029 RepID=UPI001895ED16|nr:NAD(P)H-dependent oxidoreductase [Nocardia elegans]MBF6245663.1 NAD(P)H-dependent oxidoreductase [Nocardia elegans]